MPTVLSEITSVHIAIILLILIAAYQLITIKKPEWSLSELGSGKKSGRYGRTGSGTPILDSYSTDFTQMVTEKDMDPVIGRTDEIKRLAQVLSRRNKNNAILLGSPGVGKTAIVEGLAQRIVKNEVPQTLQGKRLLSLNVTALLSGTKYRGEFEKRAQQLVDEIARCDRSVIMFIDEIHTVIQSQGSEGSVNFSDILKPALARGDLQMIGATTIDEYNKYFKTDPALARRFLPIQVNEPSVNDAIAILKGIQEKYKTFHNVEFTDAAVEAAVRITHKKITGRTLPDKAIDALDEAASMVRVSHIAEAVEIVLYHAALAKHPSLKKVWKNIQVIDKEICDLPSASSSKKKKLIVKREILEKTMNKAGVLIVDASDVESVVDEWTH